MRLVVDANVVISALTAKGVARKAFLLNSLLEKLEFIAPELLWTEVEKHKPRLLSETRLPANEFEEALEFLNEEIDIVPFREFIGLLPEAEKACPDPKAIGMLFDSKKAR